MTNWDWASDFPYSITVCDVDGMVLEMNEKAAVMYGDYGGKELIGKNLLDCHPEPARSKLLRLLKSGERNIYPLEKSGIRKLIVQIPLVSQ